MYNPFRKHPKEVNETYLEHMWCALKFSVTLYYLSYIALVHSIFPFLFTTTASDKLYRLIDEMEDRAQQRLKAQS